jgi:hypothetical protein
MKITLKALVLFSIYATHTTLATLPFNQTSTEAAGSECDLLGEMMLPEVLSAGIDLNPAKIRKFAEHPLRLLSSELEGRKFMVRWNLTLCP